MDADDLASHPDPVSSGDQNDRLPFGARLGAI
jgi:hypothetical protein